MQPPSSQPALVEVQLRTGAYHDSVTLLQVSRAVTATEGVQAAVVAMGTELNRELLAEQGFAVPPQAGPADLLVAIRADDATALAAGQAAVDRALSDQTGPVTAGPGARPPARTTGSAIRRTGANLAVVSVPGPYAFVEAMDAVTAGVSVLVFSDNVPVVQEVRLKDEAARRGALVMGPDCGTAVVSGVGLGFANVVRPGPVGLVAASGTGAQQLMCLLDGAGVGVSHCLGVGGRDLSAAVGGRSARRALELLDADPATELVVVVSKPPDPAVAADLAAFAADLATPVQLALLGPGRPHLTAAAERAVRAAGGHWSAPRSWPAPRPRRGDYHELRGLFAGGTLCDEAMVLAAAALGPVRSNVPLRPEWQLPADLRADGHVFVDFGEDQLTRSRPHPMIDQGMRLARLAEEALAAPGRVVLLDVVLGHAAHPDPAAELAPAVADALGTAERAGRDLAVVVSLCGTTGDPQGLERQAQALAAAGASVHLSNADATATAVALLGAEASADPL